MNTKEHAKAIYQRIIDLRKETDGCTAAPDLDILDCCIEHDLRYRSGEGSRRKTDAEFRKCIQGKGYVVIPWFYWLAVRIFAGRFWKNKRK